MVDIVGIIGLIIMGCLFGMLVLFILCGILANWRQ